jgi:mycothione reductase
VSAAFTKACECRFNVINEASISSVACQDGTIRLQLERHGKKSQVSAEALLLATGRVPNTDGLNALASGVRLDDEGFVCANRYLETDVAGIWTLGDIAGRFMLRHSANLEAEHVAHNVLHPDDQQAVDYQAMPHAVFASPQIGAVGMTENEVKERGRRFVAGRTDYAATAYGESLDEQVGFVKVLADADSREILGCHVIGPDAAVLVQEVANAMRQHQTTEAILRSVYIHPAAQEVVKDAFASIEWPA